MPGSSQVTTPSTRRTFFFDDVFTDLAFLHTLTHHDSSDAADLIDSPARAIASAPNPLSAHRVFTPRDGTSGYRELDNFDLKHRAMFDWLEEALGRAATPAAATGALKMP
jgi:hypothetical protein